jgi:hypothetical protein
MVMGLPMEMYLLEHNYQPNIKKIHGISSLAAFLLEVMCHVLTVSCKH